MPDPNALYEDMQKLDDMYEEHCGILMMNYNLLTMVKRSSLLTKLWRKTMNERAERINGLAA